MAFTLSPQQAYFLDWVSNSTGSCVLEAVAGAGKTTTLLEAVERTGGNVAIMAYNKKIADEISAKLAARGIGWQQAQAGTVHSFGFKAYRKAFPQVRVDGNKVSTLIVDAMGGKTAPMHALYAVRSDIEQLVSLAKQRALGVIGSVANAKLWHDIVDHFDLFSADDEEAPAVDMSKVIAFAQDILRASIEQTDVIDFDDMVYQPLARRVRFFRYSWVFVDEAQDTNPARRALVRAMLAPGGRVVAVGDRAQAIYGFTGADADSLDLIAADFGAVRLPLTTTYRCPKAVVAFAKRWVSHIQAAESAPEGSVSQITLSELFTRNDLNGHSAILCRNTKPLVALAFQLIRQGIACKVEGRDIGNGLVKLATKWKRVRTLHGLEQALAGWQDREITKALARKRETAAQAIEDQCETLRVIIDACRAAQEDSVDAVVYRIKRLFADDIDGGMLTLSTIHKSKGREWNTVYWLDRANTLPSPYARQAWQVQQEHNLCYVAATRAMTSLVEVTV